MSSQEPNDSSAGTAEIAVPLESQMLRAAYKKSGISVPDMSVATGLSTSSIQIAMNGIRYRSGDPRLAVPPDSTLVKLASVLRVHPDALRAAGRDRAAQLLEEFDGGEEYTALATQADRATKAVVTGRNALARQVLAAFSTQELQEEVERRQDNENDAYNHEIQDEIRDDLRSDQYPL